MNRTKALLVGAVGSFLLPLTASAIPPECFEQCQPTSSCSLLCYDGRVTTCGAYGICGDLMIAPSEPQASAQQPAPAQADAEEAVCRAPADQAQG